jgi:hypothetical protein
VAKVKKRAGLTGVRNVKAGKRSVTARGKAVRKKSTVGGKVRTAAQKPSKNSKAAAPDKPVGRVVIRELDPQQKCGEGTSVQFLYRVDHTVDGQRTAHLVFFDPHGWYCEHGRTCPAVAHAKKHNGQFARVS